MAHSQAEDRFFDEFQIKSLLVRERYYRDTCQWQRLRDSYHPDATKTKIKISWFHGDIEGFVAGSRRMYEGGTRGFHTITPVEVHFRGDKALTESTGTVRARFDMEGTAFDCVSWVRFISRLQKTEEAGWRLLTLEAIYEFDKISPALPLDRPVTLTLPKGSRQSYSCLAWVLEQRGFEIDQELPGTDRAESVEAFMKSEFEWLHGDVKA